jgi:hypothetical protein
VAVDYDKKGSIVASVETNQYNADKKYNNNNQLELVADGSSFPMSLTFGKSGIAYVAHSGPPFDGIAIGRTYLANCYK